MHEKLVLDNGVRIVFEKIPHVRSASVGVWVQSGTRNEPAELNGVSHFIEHMVFKGTKTKSASDMARVMDSIGGQVNAFTTKECTSFYLKTLDYHLQTGLDILFDMVLEAKFGEEDVETERGVIVEEIGMYEDSPEDLVTEQMLESIYRGSALGMPILGKRETLENMDGKTMRRYLEEHYRPENIIVAISGSFTDEHLAYVKKRFSVLTGKGENPCPPANYQKTTVVKKKDIEQTHICLGFPSIPSGSEDRYAMQIFNNILGGGMSSRLFQKVREEQGLCYSIYTFTSPSIDTGAFGIYVALSPKMQKKALEIICQELHEISENGVSEEELIRVREQIKANMLMGLESTSSRMSFLARSEMVYGDVQTPDDIIERYDAVTAEEIRALAARVLDFDQVSISAVGKVEDQAFYEKLVK